MKPQDRIFLETELTSNESVTFQVDWPRMKFLSMIIIAITRVGDRPLHGGVTKTAQVLVSCSHPGNNPSVSLRKESQQSMQADLNPGGNALGAFYQVRRDKSVLEDYNQPDSRASHPCRRRV